MEDTFGLDVGDKVRFKRPLSYECIGTIEDIYPDQVYVSSECNGKKFEAYIDLQDIIEKVV